MWIDFLFCLSTRNTFRADFLNIFSHIRPIKMFTKYVMFFTSQNDSSNSHIVIQHKYVMHRAIRHTKLVLSKQVPIMPIKRLKCNLLTHRINIPKIRIRSVQINSKTSILELKVLIIVYLLDSASATTFSLPCLYLNIYEKVSMNSSHFASFVQFTLTLQMLK